RCQTLRRRLVPLLLYNSPVSGNCYKVRLLLAHLGLEYERRTMDVVDRSNRPEVLGGLNPALRVPTLVLDDGRPLAESGAILWYFGEGTRFIPEDRYERAQVLQWMFFEQYDHEPAIAVVRFWVAYSDRPEVLADRLAASALPAYGNRTVLAPHLERLGDEGVVFERALCASPLCVPSRASLMSGLLPSRTGAYDNAGELPAGLPTFAHHLRVG